MGSIPELEEQALRSQDEGKGGGAGGQALSIPSTLQGKGRRLSGNPGREG